MSQEEAAAPRTGRREQNATLTVRRVGDGVDVLCLSGILDTEGAAALGRELAGRLRTTRPDRHLILDLTGLRLVSAAGIQVLDTHVRHLSDTPVPVIVAAPHARDIFTIAPAHGLLLCATLDAALATLPGSAFSGSTLPGPALPGPGDAPGTPEEGPEDILGRRAEARTNAVIGMAQGIILERYAPADVRTAADLLRQASQRHDVPLRVLASAIVTAPRPTAHPDAWFPGRPAAPPPRSRLLDGADQRAHDRDHVLRVLVRDVVAAADADGAEVHLVDPALGDSLILESHAGLGSAYRHHVAQVCGPPSACARARLLGQPVLVADVLTDPDLTATVEGRAASAMGSRALYAIPAFSADGACEGTVTIHHARPGPGPTHDQRAALRTLADDLAHWHAWYRRTVVLDALEYVHAHA
ncbi:ANTAR domain-containing protein [Streptomyces sp. NPDC059618]|uniref:ANTAR domain-containing protein n=1 Tax=Streptomyces sp. NPDC059618 TaxID=3346887 RepID=UPI0036860F41